METVLAADVETVQKDYRVNTKDSHRSDRTKRKQKLNEKTTQKLFRIRSTFDTLQELSTRLQWISWNVTAQWTYSSLKFLTQWVTWTRWHWLKTLLHVHLWHAEVIYQKRMLVFDRGIQTPRNRWKHEAIGRVLLLFRGVWIPASQSAPNCKQEKNKQKNKRKQKPHKHAIFASLCLIRAYYLLSFPHFFILYCHCIFSLKGPFIFYEVGGAGGIWGGVTEKKTALKGGPF